MVLSLCVCLLASDQSDRRVCLGRVVVAVVTQWRALTASPRRFWCVQRGSGHHLAWCIANGEAALCCRYCCLWSHREVTTRQGRIQYILDHQAHTATPAATARPWRAVIHIDGDSDAIVTVTRCRHLHPLLGPCWVPARLRLPRHRLHRSLWQTPLHRRPTSRTCPWRMPCTPPRDRARRPWKHHTRNQF